MRRRIIYPGTLIVVVLALSSLFLINPRPKTNAQSTSTCCGTNPSTAPREIVFPYYSLADGFNSTLLLVSDSGDPLSFIIAIHSLSGQTQLSNSMTIQPGAKLPVDMRSLLTSLGADAAGTFSQGSVSVYFEGTIMPLVGQMTIENPSRHWVQQAEMVENDPGRTDIPAVLSGQWWGLAGGRDATIMVTNASGGMVTADVILAFGGKEHKLDPLVFNPNETKLLSVASMLGTLNVSVAQAPEGRITIIQQGSNPSLVAQGRVTDPVTGFSTTLEFPDPARQHASALHASGVPVGTPTPDSPYSGDGTFTPHVIASNLSSKPQTLTLTLEYPKAATWNSTNGPGGPAAPQVRFVGILKKGEKDPNVALDNPPNPDPSVLTGEYTFGPLAVGPDSTADLSLAAVMNQLPLPIPYASIRIRYSGAPGSMIAQVSSVDARQDLVVDARTANELDGWAGSGANPWHVDSQTDSILFLTDEGEKQVRIGFSVTAGGVHYYLTSLQLAPHETRTVNIRELRDAQAADFRGNKIPAGATDGSVNWVRLDSVPVEGRLVVIQKQQGMASNYDCSICNCPAVFRALAVSPATFGLIPLAYQNMGSTATYYSCNTGTYYYDVTAGSSWSSNNTPVIKMDSSVHYRADAVSGGNASVTGGYSDCTQYDTNPDLDCPCINWPTYTASGGGTVVQITGQSAVWWFNGQTPSGYTTTVTLTALPSGGSSYTWQFTAGANKASFSNQSGNTVNVKGAALSTNINDVSVEVTVTTATGTRTSGPFNMTVEGPYRLTAVGSPNNSCVGGGFQSALTYSLIDNLGNAMLAATPMNENWTSGYACDAPYNTQSNMCNWAVPSTSNGSTTNGHFTDTIYREGTQWYPTPVCPQSPLSPTTVVHWGQEWRAGSTTSGQGARVQTDTIQEYLDHALHTGISSPAP